MTAISTNGLSRTFKLDGRRMVNALDSLSVEIERGEVHGLLGPNGAGKTTFVKILVTALLPTRGSASILGHDVIQETSAIRRLIGVVFGGDRGLYPQLTARETLQFWAALYDVPWRETRSRISALLERVGLGEWADTRVESYSRGMKQRLHLARGLISDARVLFLDEPTIGMDPVAALDFRRLVKELKGDGRTILITTHDMGEAEAVCDRVALIDHGRLLAVETPSGLTRLIDRYERVDYDGSNAALADALRLLPGVRTVTPVLAGGTAQRIELVASGHLGPVLQALVQAGITDIRTHRPSLEEVYLKMIGDRGLRT